MWTVIVKTRDKETKRALDVQMECNSIKKENCFLRSHMNRNANFYAVSMTSVRNSTNKMNIRSTNIGYAPRTDLESLIQKICAKCNCLDR
jgi:hypothetical protein